MVQATRPLTFEEFLELRPEAGRYELVDGEIVRFLPTRQHDNVADFILFALNDETRRKNLSYKVTDRIAIATKRTDGTEQGRQPDVSVVSLDVWRSNPLASSGLREPLQLAVEVVSTNWEDDYVDKVDEYQRLGIREYWIVDYLAIASRAYLGNPKVPTVFVHQLVEDRYQVQAFTGSSRIISPTFSELQLTVKEVLEAA
jgi:Uma2 family endonuclease